MRIHTRIVIDMASGLAEHEEGFEYSGPVTECKRGQAKSEADQQMQAFQQQALGLTALQKAWLNPNIGFLQKMMATPTGFSPDALSAMRTQAMSSAVNQYAPQLAQLKSSLASRGLTGGATPTSGVAGRDFGILGTQEAGQMAQNLANINIQDALQAQQNRWNAAQTLGNYAGIFNPAGYIGGASSALGSRTGLETAPTVASNLAGYWGSFGGIR